MGVQEVLDEGGLPCGSGWGQETNHIHFTFSKKYCENMHRTIDLSSFKSNFQPTKAYSNSLQILSLEIPPFLPLQHLLFPSLHPTLILLYILNSSGPAKPGSNATFTPRCSQPRKHRPSHRSPPLKAGGEGSARRSRGPRQLCSVLCACASRPIQTGASSRDSVSLL